MANRYTQKTIYKIDWNDFSNFGPVNDYDPCVYTMLHLPSNTVLTEDNQHMFKRLRTGKATNIRRRLYTYTNTDPNSRNYRTHNEDIVSESTHVEVLRMVNMPDSTDKERYRKSLGMEELEDTLIKVSWPCYNIRQKEVVING